MRIGTGVSYNIIAAALGAAGLAAAGLTMAALAAAPAAAQPANPCLALPTDAERLLCMRESRAADEASRAAAEAALAAHAGAEAQSQSQGQSQSQAQSQAQIQTQAQASAPAPAGQSAADRCFALPTDAERLSCMRDALAIAEAALAAEQEDEGGGLLGLGIFGGGGDNRADPLVASESEFAAGLGAEQLAGYRAPQEDVRVQAAIVSVTEREPGVHQFELDNGQVWRQLGGDTQQVRLGSRGPYPVELYGSWAGGYRMSIPSQRQTIQVERIR